MKKLLILSVVMAAAIFVLAACGSNSNSNDNSANGSVENTGTAVTASEKITIKAKRYEFDQAVYTIKKGVPTEITLVSEDGVHGVEVPDLDLKLSSGKAKVVTLNEAGTFEFACDIMCGSGHSKMVAKIVVE